MHRNSFHIVCWRKKGSELLPYIMKKTVFVCDYNNIKLPLTMKKSKLTLTELNSINFDSLLMISDDTQSIVNFDHIKLESTSLSL